MLACLKGQEDIPPGPDKPNPPPSIYASMISRKVLPRRLVSHVFVVSVDCVVAKQHTFPPMVVPTKSDSPEDAVKMQPGYYMKMGDRRRREKRNPFSRASSVCEGCSSSVFVIMCFPPWSRTIAACLNQREGTRQRNLPACLWW